MLYPHSTSFASLKISAERLGKTAVSAKYIIDCVQRKQLLQQSDYSFDQSSTRSTPGKRVKSAKPAKSIKEESPVVASTSRVVHVSKPKTTESHNNTSISAPILKSTTKTASTSNLQSNTASKPPRVSFSLHTSHNSTLANTASGSAKRPSSPQLPYSLADQPPPKGSPYTSDEQDFYKAYVTYLLSKDPDMGLRKMGEIISTKVRIGLSQRLRRS